MFDAIAFLKTKLETILPTHIDFWIKPDTTVPCISLWQINNSDNLVGDTLQYSNFTIAVRLWTNGYSDIVNYQNLIDETMKLVGFRRVDYKLDKFGKNDYVQTCFYNALGLEER